MREDKTKSEEGAALWRRAREGLAPPTEAEAPDALWLAAYLDDRLAEDEAARLEARLAGDPALLDELLVLRETLAADSDVDSGAVPAGVVARAQGLRPALKSVPGASGRTSWAGHLFGAWLRPAVPAFAAIVALLACAGAFELGRYQSEQMDTTQSAEVADSDVPVDLLLEGLI